MKRGVAGYLIFGLVIVGIIWHGQIQQSDFNNKLKAQTVTSDKKLAAQVVAAKKVQDEFNAFICGIAHSSWDERDAMVHELTQHTAPPPDQAGDELVVERYALSNQHKDDQRKTLLALQGPRPTC